MESYTEILVIEVRDNLLEIVLAERCEDLFLVLFTDDDVAGWDITYLMSFYIELISSSFYYIWMFE